MDEKRQNDQQEPIYNSSMPIQDIALKTSQEQWTIKTGGEREQGGPCWQRDMMIMMPRSVLIFVKLEADILALLSNTILLCCNLQ